MNPAVLWNCDHKIFSGDSIPVLQGVRSRPFPYISLPTKSLILESVVDPNTLNLDPDPECWPILDPDSDLGLLSIEKEFFFVENNYFFKIIFFNYKKIMATEEMFSQLSL